MLSLITVTVVNAVHMHAEHLLAQTGITALATLSETEGLMCVVSIDHCNQLLGS